jgi:hypothetical protein
VFTNSSEPLQAVSIGTRGDFSMTRFFRGLVPNTIAATRETDSGAGRFHVAGGSALCIQVYVKANVSSSIPIIERDDFDRLARGDKVLSIRQILSTTY